MLLPKVQARDDDRHFKRPELFKPEPKQSLTGWFGLWLFCFVKDFAEGFYTGRAWLAVRADYISRRVRIDGGLCERCHERLGYIVHHRIELDAQNISDPEISLNQALLEYVCLECHNKEHGVFQPAPRKVIFDDEGNVIDVIDRKR